MSKSKATKKKSKKTGDALRKEVLAKITGGNGSSGKSDKAPKQKKMSGLDAAAKVLADSKEPLTCKAIVTAAIERKYWTSPAGKTPHATIYSAMIREIKDKGSASRFKKAERGLFIAA